jgi:hypothetical protein
VSDASAGIGWRGAWGVAGSSSYLGGKAHFTRAATGVSTFRFTGTAVSWIGPQGPGRGKSRVYIDGTLVAVVDQYASTFAARRVIFSRNVTSGTHTLVIKAAGTPGRSTVAVDALEILAAG